MQKKKKSIAYCILVKKLRNEKKKNTVSIFDIMYNPLFIDLRTIKCNEGFKGEIKEFKFFVQIIDSTWGRGLLKEPFITQHQRGTWLPPHCNFSSVNWKNGGQNMITYVETKKKVIFLEKFQKTEYLYQKFNVDCRGRFWTKMPISLIVLSYEGFLATLCLKPLEKCFLSLEESVWHTPEVGRQSKQETTLILENWAKKVLREQHCCFTTFVSRQQKDSPSWYRTNLDPIVHRPQGNVIFFGFARGHVSLCQSFIFGTQLVCQFFFYQFKVIVARDTSQWNTKSKKNINSLFNCFPIFWFSRDKKNFVTGTKRENFFQLKFLIKCFCICWRQNSWL